MEWENELKSRSRTRCYEVEVSWRYGAEAKAGAKVGSEVRS